MNLSRISRAYKWNTSFSPSHPGRAYAAGSTPSRSLGSIFVPGQFQAGAGPQCYCVLPSHPHSWKPSLKSLLMSLPQYPAEKQGSWWVRAALDATSAGDRSAARPPSKLLSFSHGATPLSSAMAAGMEHVQRGRSLAGPWGMSKRDIFFPPLSPRKTSFLSLLLGEKIVQSCEYKYHKAKFIFCIFSSF